MKYKRPRGRHIEIPVASLGDIAFLLITFFMFCSTFSRSGGGKIDPPLADNIVQMKEGKVLVEIDQDGKIYVQGQPSPGADAVESTVASIVDNAKTDQDRVVMFKCDKHQSKQVFEPVLAAIAKAGGTIAALGERPKDLQAAAAAQR